MRIVRRTIVVGKCEAILPLLATIRYRTDGDGVPAVGRHAHHLHPRIEKAKHAEIRLQKHPGPELSDLHETKRVRGKGTMTIGDVGPMGRILVRGEPGHDIIPELYPIAGEPVVDKPGKGAFYATELTDLVEEHGLTQLIVCGVTTEVCVHTTVREANDRGIECLVLSDCTGSYFPEFHETALRMIAAQGGIFGWVGDSASVIAALTAPAEPERIMEGGQAS